MILASDFGRAFKGWQALAAPLRAWGWLAPAPSAPPRHRGWGWRSPAPIAAALAARVEVFHGVVFIAGLAVPPLLFTLHRGRHRTAAKELIEFIIIMNIIIIIIIIMIRINHLSS